jgi:hypothetical protein
MEKQKPTVKLIGEDGNAFAIIGKVNKAMRKVGYSQEEIKKYNDEAMSGDYDNLLQVTMQTVNVK